MVSVCFYGTLRAHFKMTHLEVEAYSVKDLIIAIEKITEVACRKELKNALTFVNEINFLFLKKHNTALKPGDKVTFLSPASGG